MKYLKILILLVFTTAIAESQPLFKLNYNISFPNANMKDFVGSTSFSGVSFDYGQYLSKGTYSVGLCFGWNIFSDHYFGTTTFTALTGNSNLSGAVTGNQVKYVNAFPLLATGSYYFKPQKSSMVPFITVGAGTYYIVERYQIGIYEAESKLWHAGISAETGMLFNFNKEIGLNTSAKLNYAFDSGNSITGKDINDFSFWTVNIGLSYKY